MAKLENTTWQSLNEGYLGDFDKEIPLHAPTLYAYDEIYQVEVNGWDELKKRTDETVKEYHDKGCVIVRNAFDPKPAIEALNDIIDGNNVEFNEACERTKKHLADNGDGGCVNSILQFEAAAKAKWNQLSKEERRDYVRKLHGFLKYDERFKRIAYHPPFLEFIGKLLGLKNDEKPEVFQDMILVKPPNVGREKPWHQDHAYFNLSEDTHVVGTWISLDWATTENGCMHILPGQHRQSLSSGKSKKIWNHFMRRDWQICDKDIEDAHREQKVKIAAVCLNPGDVMIFDSLVPHGTPANLSPARRRALQFHYIAPNTPRVPTEERLRLFGGEGRGAVC